MNTTHTTETTMTKTDIEQQHAAEILAIDIIERGAPRCRVGGVLEFDYGHSPGGGWFRAREEITQATINRAMWLADHPEEFICP